jgi:radical SAM protein with 4Fe4S-binding SPASM domain
MSTTRRRGPRRSRRRVPVLRARVVDGAHVARSPRRRHARRLGVQRGSLDDNAGHDAREHRFRHTERRSVCHCFSNRDGLGHRQCFRVDLTERRRAAIPDPAHRSPAPQVWDASSPRTDEAPLRNATARSTMTRPRRALSVLGNPELPERPPLGNEVRDVDRLARPLYAVWEITLRCDLACKHCGSRAGKARAAELSTAEALDFVDQMAAMGVREVSLIGGEVYLRDDWTEIARHVKSKGMVCGIVTGGRGFTRERADMAKDVGVDGVSVSIDGLEDSHDDLRGVHGSFRAAIAALGHARDVGLARAVNTQINRRNRHDIPAVLAAVSPFEPYGWQVQFTVAMGRAVDNADALLQPYDLLEVVPMLAELRAVCDAQRIRFWPGNNVGYFGPFESVFRGKDKRGHLEPCTAGRSTLGVEANGDIKGCPSLPTSDYAGGNIRRASLRDIWERAPALQFTRLRTKEDLWGHCRTCYYADDCLGGCTWTSHVLFARRGNNPYCHHRALELLEKGLRERLVRTEEAPGLPFDFGRFQLIEEPWPEAELEKMRSHVRATWPAGEEAGSRAPTASPDARSA